MSLPNFKEYLADRVKNPQKYSDITAGKSPSKNEQNEKPLGNLATPGMIPKNSAPHGEAPVKPKQPVAKKMKKMKVENFLNKTKKLSNAEFTKKMLEDVKKTPSTTIRDLYGNEFVPEPAQTMKYISNLMLTNENMMRRMVRELKRNEGFHLLISEILQHPETYNYLIEAYKGGFGEMAEKKLINFTETVSPPRTGPASENAPGNQPKGGAFGGGSTPMQGQPQAGISGGPNAGGGFNVTGGGNMQGMGEEEHIPGMNMDEPTGEMDDEAMGDEEEHDEEGLDSEDDDDLVSDDEDDEEEDDEDDQEDGEEDEMGHESPEMNMTGNMGGSSIPLGRM